MRKQRRLSDLYLRGKKLSVDDGEDHPVEVWLQKLNEVDRESVLRRANAARARFLIEADNEDSDVFQAMYGRIREFADRDGLVAITIATDVAKARQRLEAEASNDEETWAKDSYFQGLSDSWMGDADNPGLAEVAVEDPDDPEVKRVKAELERFDHEVSDRMREEVQRMEADWADRPLDELWRDATKVMLERTSDEAFGREYERQQLFHAVRDPRDHSKRYFSTVTEIDDLDDELRLYLSTQYSSLLVEATEGKESRASQDSSASSATPEVTSERSGLEAVSA